MSASAWNPNSTTVAQANANGLLKQEKQTASKDQRYFTIKSFAYAVGTGSLLVFKSGQILSRNVDFFEVDPTSFMLAEPANEEDDINIIGFVGISGTALVDAILRSDLFADTGANIINSKASTTLTLTRSLGSRVGDSFINIKDTGAKCDGVFDDGPAIQAAVIAVAKSGGGVLNFGGANRVIKIATPVLIPPNVRLCGGGVVVKGNGTGTNTIFESATFDAAGNLVSNINAAPQIALVNHVSITDFIFMDCGIALNLHNCIDNCEFRNIYFENCTRNIWARSCFYAVYSNLVSRGTANNAQEAAFFFDDNVNANHLHSISCINRALAYDFTGIVSGTNIHCVNAESCGIGIRIRAMIAGTNITGCYFEANTVCDLDMSEASDQKYGAIIEGNFFNQSIIGIAGKSVYTGRIGHNQYNNCQTNVQINDELSTIEVCIPDTLFADNGIPIAQGDFIFGSKVKVNSRDIIYSSGTGAALLINKTSAASSAPVEFNYTGSTHKMPSDIPFCTHSKSAGTVNFSVYVDTQIAFDSYSFVAFTIKIGDNDSLHIFDGRAFENRVYLDSTGGGKTVVSSNNNGKLRLEFQGINHPTEFYSISGEVRHF